MTRLDRIATVQARIGWKALTAAEYQDEGYAFLATPNIKTSSIDFDDVNYISHSRYEESPELKLQVGDVLLAKDGSTLGIANCVRSLPRPATVNGSIAVLRPRGVDPRFLMYWLQGSVIQGRIAEVKDGMGVPHLFQADIKKFPVPDLAAAEYERIADFLDDRVARIDQIIAARHQQLAAAMEAGHEEVRRLITTGDGPTIESGIPWMPRVGSNWRVPRVSHIFRTGSGSTPPSEERSYYDGGVPWVNTGDVRDAPLGITARSLSESALDDFSMLVRYPKGSLVIAMYGQGATKGRAALLDRAACVNQACCVLMADRELTRWAFFWFKAYKRYIVQLALGSGQPNLSQDIIRSVRLPLAPDHDRDSILREIAASELRTRLFLDSAGRSIKLLAAYKSSLITAAVTGELDVTTAGSGVPG